MEGKDKEEAGRRTAAEGNLRQGIGVAVAWVVRRGRINKKRGREEAVALWGFKLGPRV